MRVATTLESSNSPKRIATSIFFRDQIEEEIRDEEVDPDPR